VCARLLSFVKSAESRLLAVLAQFPEVLRDRVAVAGLLRVLEPQEGNAGSIDSDAQTKGVTAS